MRKTCPDCGGRLELLVFKGVGVDKGKPDQIRIGCKQCKAEWE